MSKRGVWEKTAKLPCTGLLPNRNEWLTYPAGYEHAELREPKLC